MMVFPKMKELVPFERPVWRAFAGGVSLWLITACGQTTGGVSEHTGAGGNGTGGQSLAGGAGGADGDYYSGPEQVSCLVWADVNNPPADGCPLFSAIERKKMIPAGCVMMSAQDEPVNAAPAVKSGDCCYAISVYTCR